MDWRGLGHSARDAAIRSRTAGHRRLHKRVGFQLTSPMSIFDDIPRENTEPPQPLSEGQFAYPNRSSRLEAACVRKGGRMGCGLPDPHRDDLAARFSSAIDDQHQSEKRFGQGTPSHASIGVLDRPEHRRPVGVKSAHQIGDSPWTGTELKEIGKRSRAK